jgi:hypothetical protein
VHQLDRVRKGPIIVALLVLFFARLFGRLLTFLPVILFPKSTAKFPD